MCYVKASRRTLGMTTFSSTQTPPEQTWSPIRVYVRVNFVNSGFVVNQNTVTYLFKDCVFAGEYCD